MKFGLLNFSFFSFLYFFNLYKIDKKKKRPNMHVNTVQVKYLTYKFIISLCVYIYKYIIERKGDIFIQYV